MNTMLLKAFARNMKSVKTMQRAVGTNQYTSYNSLLRVSSRHFSNPK